MITALQLVRLCDSMMQADSDADFLAAEILWDDAISKASPDVIKEAELISSLIQPAEQ